MNTVVLAFLGAALVTTALVQLGVQTWRSAFLRAFAAAVILSLVFQILNYFHVGYIDPLALVAVVIQVVIVFIVGILVGSVYLAIRKKSR